MYAIIKDSGKQYKVSEGDVIDIDIRDDAEKGKELVFSEVLLASDGTNVKIGTPLVTGVTVTGVIMNEFRSKKIIIQKFKRKKNYRRRKGHRQDLLKVKITKVTIA